MKKNELTRAVLRAAISYDSSTGEFTRRVTHSNIKAGTRCGHKISSGDRYPRISVYGFQYHAHRLAWLYFYGVWPSEHIDHINRNPLDNRIANLRDVSQLQNNRNCKTHSDNTSGHRGVYWHKASGSWHAMVFHKRRCISLGYFKTREGAIVARLAGERMHYGSDRSPVSRETRPTL